MKNIPKTLQTQLHWDRQTRLSCRIFFVVPIVSKSTRVFKIEIFFIRPKYFVPLLHRPQCKLVCPLHLWIFVRFNPFRLFHKFTSKNVLISADNSPSLSQKNLQIEIYNNLQSRDFPCFSFRRKFLQSWKKRLQSLSDLENSIIFRLSLLS